MESIRAAVFVRTRDRVRVLEALGALAKAEGLQRVEPEQAELHALILPPAGRWVTIYLDPTTLAASVAREVAAQTGTPTLTLRVLDDGAALSYDAFDPSGALADTYHSCPDYDKAPGQDDASPDELARTRGDAPTLAQTLGGLPGDLVHELTEALSSARIERLRDHDAYDGPSGATDLLRTLTRLFSLPELVDVDDVLADADELRAHPLAFRG